MAGELRKFAHGETQGLDSQSWTHSDILWIRIDLDVVEDLADCMSMCRVWGDILFWFTVYPVALEL